VLLSTLPQAMSALFQIAVTNNWQDVMCVECKRKARAQRARAKRAQRARAKRAHTCFLAPCGRALHSPHSNLFLHAIFLQVLQLRPERRRPGGQHVRCCACEASAKRVLLLLPVADASTKWCCCCYCRRREHQMVLLLLLSPMLPRARKCPLTTVCFLARLLLSPMFARARKCPLTPVCFLARLLPRAGTVPSFSWSTSWSWCGSGRTSWAP
jgi:hypothetical protein